MKKKLLITSDRFLEQDRKLAEMLNLGKGEPETIDIECEVVEPSKIMKEEMWQTNRVFPDALRCENCGQIVERGIINVSNHAFSCPKKGRINFSDVYDAEIVEPKLLTDKE